jgi:hypothetical protein
LSEITLTDELRRRICRALNGSWDEIAGDILDAVAEERGKGHTRHTVTISREHVAEVAADAGRLTRHGLTKDEMFFYYDLPPATKASIVCEAFKSRRYGY